MKKIFDEETDAKYFAQVLSTLLEDGFEPPLYVSVIANNGIFLIFRYDWDENQINLKVAPLADNSTEISALRIPINMMFVDSRGEAARVLINNQMGVEIKN